MDSRVPAEGAVSVVFALSLHDALPISAAVLPAAAAAVLPVAAGAVLPVAAGAVLPAAAGAVLPVAAFPAAADRKSTRLNSSHANISYAVFCLKKKKRAKNRRTRSRRPG